MFHDDEPENGSVLPGSLPSPQVAFRGYIPLVMTQRTTVHIADGQDQQTGGGGGVGTASSAAAMFSTDNNDASSRRPGTPLMSTQSAEPYSLELRNQDVELPQADDTRFWCKVFELQDFRQKHHLIKVLCRCVYVLEFMFWFSVLCACSLSVPTDRHRDIVKRCGRTRR